MSERTSQELALAVALVSGGAGSVHLWAVADHADDPVMAIGFAAFGVAQLALALILPFARDGLRTVACVAAAIAAASVALWLVSRTVGLPLVSAGHVEPVGAVDAATKLFELACLGGALVLVARPRGRRSLARRHGPPPQSPRSASA